MFNGVNSYKNSKVIQAKTSEKLLAAVRSIAARVKIDHVWSDGKNHHCIITTSRPLNKNDQKIINEVLNG